MNRSKRIALVLFGGSGERFQSDLPKQFVDCGGQPMMAATLNAIAAMPFVSEIYVVSHPDYIDLTNQVIDHYVNATVYGVIPGGNSRHESVENALGYFEEKGESDDTLIAIFDGDRPGITPEIAEECYNKAEIYGAAVTAVPATDSVFESFDESSVHAYLDRKCIFLAQTPQTFQLRTILDAYANCQNPSTDDASLVVAMGKKVEIVLGSHENDKITFPEDLVRFLALRR